MLRCINVNVSSKPTDCKLSLLLCSYATARMLHGCRSSYLERKIFMRYYKKPLLHNFEIFKKKKKKKKKKTINTGQLIQDKTNTA